MTEVSHSCRGTFEIMEPTEHQQSEKKKLLLVPVIMMLLCIVILTLQLTTGPSSAAELESDTIVGEYSLENLFKVIKGSSIYYVFRVGGGGFSQMIMLD